jgi:hypothetical protein
MILIGRAPVCVVPLVAAAQSVHEHAMPVNAVGMAAFRSSVRVRPRRRWPTAAGRRRQPGRAARFPSAGAKVLIPAGRQVAYVESATAVQCVEVRGQLAFDTGRNTKLTVVTLIVMEEGLLEVGSEARPVAAAARAEIVIADRPFDYTLDPGQVKRHHRTRPDQDARRHQDADLRAPDWRCPCVAGDVHLDRPLQGWAAGDRIVFPDTRQLREQERGARSPPATNRLRSRRSTAPPSASARRWRGTIRRRTGRAERPPCARTSATSPATSSSRRSVRPGREDT